MAFDQMDPDLMALPARMRPTLSPAQRPDLVSRYQVLRGAVS